MSITSAHNRCLAFDKDNIKNKCLARLVKPELKPGNSELLTAATSNRTCTKLKTIIIKGSEKYLVSTQFVLRPGSCLTKRKVLNTSCARNHGQDYYYLSARFYNIGKDAFDLLHNPFEM